MKSWKKGSLHCHTLWSDGRSLPEMVLHTYKELGYNFVSLTDHNIFQDDPAVWLQLAAEEGAWPSQLSVAEYERTCAALPGVVDYKDRGFRKFARLKTYEELAAAFNEPDEFLLIPGEEVTCIDCSFGENSERKYHLHLNLIDHKHRVDAITEGSALEITQKIMAQADVGALTTLNHPYWLVWDVPPELLIECKELKFFEICNNGTTSAADNWIFGREKFCDFVLAHRIKRGNGVIYLTASDDAHYYNIERRKNMCAINTGYIMVNMQDDLSADSVKSAMLAGDFYASTGVKLRDVAFDKKSKTLKVEVAPEKDTTYRIDFITTGKDFDSSIEYAEYPHSNPKFSRRRPIIREDVGVTAKSVEGVSGEYTMTGDDLYVRCVVTSSKENLLQNPFYPRYQTAWSQPFENSQN